MEITHIAHSCFKIKGKSITLLIDPFDDAIGYKMPRQKCDVLLLTHGHSDHANKSSASDYNLFIDGPGEYEVSGVSILGFKTYHDASEGSERGLNTLYWIDIDGFKIMHLGDLGHILEPSTLEKVPEVDVLMTPVGGGYTIDAKIASKVISSLEPGIVIPMHYQMAKLSLGTELDPLDKFLNEMGIEKANTHDKLKISRRSDIPEETEIRVLTVTA